MTDKIALAPADNGRVNRRLFCKLLAATPLAIAMRCKAQGERKPARVGILSGSDTAATRKVFTDAMHNLGWTENRDVVYVERSAKGDFSRLEQLTAELVAEKVDIIRTSNADVAIAAARVTKTLPIVFATSADPVGVGAVASLARPGGNITGLSTANAELTTKRVELLRQLRPDLKRLAMLRSPPETDVSVTPVAAAARALGLEFQLFRIQRPDEISDVFTEMAKWKAEGLLVTATPLIVSQHKQVVRHALRVHLPVVYARSDVVEQGGLMSYAADFADNYRRSAWYVDKILKGAKPADLPVQQPTKFELVINLKTARALGLTIPQSILVRADRMIE